MWWPTAPEPRSAAGSAPSLEVGWPGWLRSRWTPGAAMPARWSPRWATPEWWWTTSTPSAWPTRSSTRSAGGPNRPPSASGPQRDPLYRIRKLLLTAQEQLTQRGRARLRAGLAAGDPGGEVAAAWQGKELLRAVYRAVGMSAAGAALDRFYRWADGVQSPELPRLAHTPRPSQPA